MINESDITLIYTVGGYNVHYDNMMRSIKSIKEKSKSYNFLILEFGKKLSTCDEYTVINLPDEIDFTSGKKVGYLIWKHKYVGALKIKTKYGVYVDSDTVMANNNIVHLCKLIDNGFGVTKHFWVPNIAYYQQRACTQETIDDFLYVKKILGLEDTDDFFAGGVFIFKNNKKNQMVMNKVLEYYKEYYDNKDYVSSITDELFLAAALKSCHADIKIIGGGLNHCSMGDTNMPMYIIDGLLYGKNSFEDQPTKITFLHCDISRRDPSKEYEGSMKTAIRKLFKIN